MKIINDKYITLFTYEESQNFLKALKKSANFVSNNKVKNKFSEDNFNEFNDIVVNHLINNLRGLYVLENNFMNKQLMNIDITDFLKEKTIEVLQEIHKYKTFSTSNADLISSIQRDLNANSFSDEVDINEVNKKEIDKLNYLDADKLIEYNSKRITYLLSDVMPINNKILNKLIKKAISKVKNKYGTFSIQYDVSNGAITNISNVKNNDKKTIFKKIKEAILDELNQCFTKEIKKFNGCAKYNFYKKDDNKNDFPIYFGIKLDLTNLNIDSQIDYLKMLEIFSSKASHKNNFGIIAMSFDGKDINVKSSEKF